MCYVRKEEGKFDMEWYIEYFDCYKVFLVRCFDVLVDLKYMGLFYNIEENILVLKIIEILMVLLKKWVGEFNFLFNCELRLVGSVFEGMKVNFLDEFDYLWVLMEFCEVFLFVELLFFFESFVKLKFKKDVDVFCFRRYVIEENFLDSSLFIWDFNWIVNEVFMDILKYDW